MSGQDVARGAGFEAIVLAGGLGTRLRSVVGSLPKVLAEVAGRPFIEHLLARLQRAGCKRAILAVSYGRERVIEAIGSAFAGLPLEYSIEETPLGTGGAVQLSLARVSAAHALVVNGDTWIELDYAAMLEAHRTAGAKVSVAVTRVDDVGRYGAVSIDTNERIERFAEKGESRPGYINGGVYGVRRDVFDGFDLPQVFSFERDFLMAHCDRLRPLAFQTQGRFIDIGVPQDYALAQGLLRERAGS